MHLGLDGLLDSHDDEILDRKRHLHFLVGNKVNKCQVMQDCSAWSVAPRCPREQKANRLRFRRYSWHPATSLPVNAFINIL